MCIFLCLFDLYFCDKIKCCCCCCITSKLELRNQNIYVSLKYLYEKKFRTDFRRQSNCSVTVQTGIIVVVVVVVVAEAVVIVVKFIQHYYNNTITIKI